MAAEDAGPPRAPTAWAGELTSPGGWGAGTRGGRGRNAGCVPTLWGLRPSLSSGHLSCSSTGGHKLGIGHSQRGEGPGFTRAPTCVTITPRALGRPDVVAKCHLLVTSQERGFPVLTRVSPASAGYTPQVAPQNWEQEIPLHRQRNSGQTYKDQTCQSHKRAPNLPAPRVHLPGCWATGRSPGLGFVLALNVQWNSGLPRFPRPL